MKLQVETGDISFDDMKQISLQDLFIQQVLERWPENMVLNRATMLKEGQAQFDHYTRDRRRGHKTSVLPSEKAWGATSLTPLERKFLKRVGNKRLRREVKRETERQVQEHHAVEREAMNWYERSMLTDAEQDYMDYLNDRDHPDLDYDPYDDWYPHTAMEDDQEDHLVWWHGQRDGALTQPYGGAYVPRLVRSFVPRPYHDETQVSRTSLDDRVITSADQGMTLGELLRQHLGN